jgi:hypothetical protein
MVYNHETLETVKQGCSETKVYHQRAEQVEALSSQNAIVFITKRSFFRPGTQASFIFYERSVPK